VIREKRAKLTKQCSSWLWTTSGSSERISSVWRLCSTSCKIWRTRVYFGSKSDGFWNCRNLFCNWVNWFLIIKRKYSILQFSDLDFSRRRISSLLSYIFAIRLVLLFYSHQVNSHKNCLLNRFQNQQLGWLETQTINKYLTIWWLTHPPVTLVHP